ncbi:MAG: NAD(P)-dependent oxidoreductase [Devosia sp.]|nr:NAD(P)-dependent oxidoreductase [Devosia sp.]
MANGAGPRSVLVTGAGGNLGSRLVGHLVSREWCEAIYCLDVRPMSGEAFASSKVQTLIADLADPRDRRWQEAAERAEAIVHFAVKNPLPSGNWDDAVAAIDMTANLIEHARPEGCRFLFASSNHVMGGYKDADWSKLGSLSYRTTPYPGTRFFAGGGYHQPNMYGGSKLVGERLLRAHAINSAGRFTAVSMRIGWCLGKDGHPSQINPEGGGVAAGGTAVQPADEQARDLIWFRNMWLSHRDFLAQFEAALTADAAGWPEPAIVVNAVSANRGTLWDMADARAWLGHVPQDDVWTALGIDPP